MHNVSLNVRGGPVVDCKFERCRNSSPAKASFRLFLRFAISTCGGRGESKRENNAR
jgi:hypothetical protein